MGFFYSGKIYGTRYLKWKHDSMPLVFVLYSDINKTHALNLHYLPQPMIIQFISFIKKFKGQFNTVWSMQSLGRAVYNIMKRYYPMWAKTAYRTYHTRYLSGYMINDGITPPVKGMISKTTQQVMTARDIMAKAINANIQEQRETQAKMPEPVAPSGYLGMK